MATEMKVCDNCRTINTCLELGCGQGRADQPADVGATMQELPTYYYDIDGSLRMKGREFEYGGTGEYVRAQDVREAIAADHGRQKARIMHLTYERDKARDDLRAQLAAATENLKTAVQQAWTANAELSKLRAQLARQSQDELAYFYRQRHTGLNWVETDRDPRALFAGTPMEVCMEYRTLYAAPPLPSKPQAEYREALEMCAKALEGFGIAKSARDFALQNARRVLDESQAEKGADACGS
jgi:hypothetical protein